MIPLQDREAEIAVLNAMIYEQECIDGLGLKAGDFTHSRNQALFTAIIKIHEAGRTLDQAAVFDQLRTDKVTIDSGMLEQISPVTAANVAYYAKKVRELSQKRQIVEMLHGVKDDLDGKSAEEIVDRIEQRLTELYVGDEGDVRKVGDFLEPALNTIEQRYSGHGSLPGLSTGFTELDHVLTGFHPGNLIVIGARPSQGKTALALTMALYQALEGIPVGFFSCEMTGEQLVMRALAGIGRINSQSVSTGILKHTDFAKLTEAGCRLRDAPLIVDETPYISLTQLRSRARKMRRMGVRCIYVDYLTLIRHGDSRTPRYERVGEISKSLKFLSRELQIPFVALSQVGREAEDRMPTMADLRQSGEIEEDADVIIFLHRDRKKSGDADRGDRLTLVDVAKNRHGATETVQLIFIPEYVRFESKAHESNRQGAA